VVVWWVERRQDDARYRGYFAGSKRSILGDLGENLETRLQFVEILQGGEACEWLLKMFVIVQGHCDSSLGSADIWRGLSKRTAFDSTSRGAVGYSRSDPIYPSAAREYL